MTGKGPAAKRKRKKKQKVSSPLYSSNWLSSLAWTMGGGGNKRGYPLNTKERGVVVVVVGVVRKGQLSKWFRRRLLTLMMRHPDRNCVSEVVQSCSAKRKLAHTAHPTDPSPPSLLLLLLLLPIPQFPRAASSSYRVDFFFVPFSFLRL